MTPKIAPKVPRPYELRGSLFWHCFYYGGSLIFCLASLWAFGPKMLTSRLAQQTTEPNWVWLLFGLVVLACIGGAVYFFCLFFFGRKRIVMTESELIHYDLYGEKKLYWEKILSIKFHARLNGLEYLLIYYGDEKQHELVFLSVLTLNSYKIDAFLTAYTPHGRWVRNYPPGTEYLKWATWHYFRRLRFLRWITGRLDYSLPNDGIGIKHH